MKKVLIQDRFSREEVINSLKDILEDNINDKQIELDLVFCLREAKDKITSYNLIISHPHIDTDCCMPLVKTAIKNNIPVVFVYKGKYPHGEKIEAIAQNLKLDIIYRFAGEQEEVYYNTIKKYLLAK